MLGPILAPVLRPVLTKTLDTVSRSPFGPELFPDKGTFTTSSGSTYSQPADMKNATTYALSYTASAAGVGNIILYANGFAAVHNVLAGTNTVSVVPTTATSTATDTIRIGGVSSGTISNISVREVRKAVA